MLHWYEDHVLRSVRNPRTSTTPVISTSLKLRKQLGLIFNGIETVRIAEGEYTLRRIGSRHIMECLAEVNLVASNNGRWILVVSDASALQFHIYVFIITGKIHSVIFAPFD